MASKPDFTHQMDIFDPNMFTWPIHVIGLGGIGSALLPPLLKLSDYLKVHLWDDDSVEPHNLPAQLIYRPKDVGLKKVEAARKFAERQGSNCKIVTHEKRVDADTELEGIVIGGVDSMKSRHKIWQVVKAKSAFIPLYMDGRIGGEQWDLITIDPLSQDDCDWYERNMLFSDEEAAQLPCAARTVIHPPLALASQMIANLTLFSRELERVRWVSNHMKTTQSVAVPRR